MYYRLIQRRKSQRTLQSREAETCYCKSQTLYLRYIQLFKTLIINRPDAYTWIYTSKQTISRSNKETQYIKCILTGIFFVHIQNLVGYPHLSKKHFSNDPLVLFSRKNPLILKKQRSIAKRYSIKYVVNSTSLR